MNLPAQRQLDPLTDGLLIVSSAERAVLYANPAARRMLPLTTGQPLAGQWLHNQISAIQRGYLKAPLIFEIDVPGPNGLSTPDQKQIQVTLLPSPLGNDFIALLKNITEQEMYENLPGNLVSMLDSAQHARQRESLARA